MLERTVTIANRVGLHARPAAEFVKLAGHYRCDVKLTKDDLTVDGKSIMGVMMLAAGKGSEVILYADGEDEDESIQKLVELINNRFNEDE